MNPTDAIARLTRAISLVSDNDNFDKDELLGLVEEAVEGKHWVYVETGLAKNDKASILRGLMGALSHHETEQQKEHNDKKFKSLKQ